VETSDARKSGLKRICLQSLLHMWMSGNLRREEERIETP